MKAAIFGTRRDEIITPSLNAIKDALVKNGVKVDESYFDTTVGDMASDLSHTYTSIKNILLRNDIIIVENSKPSTGIGLIIGRVMELKKPMLVLVNKDLKTTRGPSIVVKAHGMKFKKISYEEYSLDTIEEITDSFYNESKKLLNSKFLFNLSPGMAQYLQWSSEYYSRPMVEILRELISKGMEEDKDWNEYQKTF